MNTPREASVGTQEEEKIAIMGGWDRRNGRRVGLKNAETGYREKDKGSGAPLVDLPAMHSNLSNSTWKTIDDSFAWAHVVVQISKRACHSIDKIEANGDPDIHPSMESRRRYVDHYCNDETKEGKNMLDDKELVGEIPKRCQRAQVDPEENCVGGHSCQGSVSKFTSKGRRQPTGRGT